eukprot:TRINITY_DN69694_c0_g1_i1.p1 TRINITY_DN69694_c0_g1~~TRINITY_DN69694_c0_g1_i1.p1  ORF type:complete len:324 (-),score=39.73 TRINITY_DN69694_c0_g1_i1:91-1041(-)
MVALSLSSATLVCSGVVGCVSGLLIGAIGVGGVILVPTLTQLPGIDVHQAIVACMFSYIFAGIAGSWMYFRKNDINWKCALIFCVVATPASFMGSFLLSKLTAVSVKVMLYVLIVVSSVFTLGRLIHQKCCQTPTQKLETKDHDEHTNNKGDEEVPPEDTIQEIGSHQSIVDFAPAGALFSESHSAVLFIVYCCGVGTVVGVGSALTGTSGPVILLPILISSKWPILHALGIAQLIQIPISISATIGNVVFNSNFHPSWVLGGVLAVALVVFVPVGALIAHAMPQKLLQMVVVVVLLIASIFMLSKEVVHAIKAHH